MTPRQIKKLEKIAKALNIVTEQFDQLMNETNGFDYHSNGNFAQNSLDRANTIIQGINKEFSR